LITVPWEGGKKKEGGRRNSTRGGLVDPYALSCGRKKKRKKGGVP